MKITQNEDEIILRYFPLGFWMMGVLGVFLFGGCFIWMVVYTIFNPREIFKSDDGGWLGSIFSVVIYILFLVFIGALLAAFAGLILSSVITTKINRKSQIVEISRRNLLKNKIKRFEFFNVERFGAQKTQVRTGFQYYLALRTVNSSWIELETKGHSEDEIEKIAEKLNSFIKI